MNTAPAGPRLLIYSQDGLGLGHQRRTSLLATAFLDARPDASVLTMSDSPIGQFFSTSAGHDYLKLPSIRKLGPGDWRAVSLSMPFHDVLGLRRDLIRIAADRFGPDVLLVDHMPHGAMGELLPTLELLRGRGVRTVLGLRDIVDSPTTVRRRWQVEGAFDAVRQYFDRVLVYGSRTVFDVAAQYAWPTDLRERLHYCGYVCAPSPSGTPDEVRRHVLGDAPDSQLVVAMAGGGADSHRLFATLLRAVPALLRQRRCVVVVVTGPFLPESQRAELRVLARGLPVRLVHTVDDAPSYIAAADLVVGMAGYNTTVEIVSMASRALLVPRPGPSAEQRMRASRFAERGWVGWLSPESLTPELLAEAMLDALTGPPPRASEAPDLGGTARAVQHLLSRDVGVAPPLRVPLTVPPAGASGQNGTPRPKRPLPGPPATAATRVAPPTTVRAPTTAPPVVTTASRSGPSLDEVLSGALGVDAVRQVVVSPRRHGLADLLEACHPTGRVAQVRLLRTKYKPGHKLTGYYRARVEGAGREPVPLAVSWSSQPAADPLPVIRAGAGRGAFARLTARSSDGSTSLLVSPADPAMPQLARLHDPVHLAELMAGLTHGAPDTGHAMEVRSIRYRPGQRHVLHVTAPLTGPDGLFLKSDRDDSGARAVPAATALEATLAGRCPGARLVDAVGYAAAERTAVWRGASGLPLQTWLRHDPEGGYRLVHLVGRALRVLHDTSVAVPGSRSVSQEATATVRAGEHLEALLPPVGRRYQELVASVVAALDRWPGEEAGVVHGDVKCDNLLVEGDSQVRILDLDRVCRADPALDLGKFLADLQWWSPPARLSGLRAALRDGYGTCDRARWARAELLEVLFRAKLAARRCDVLDPGWESQVRSHLDGAVATLEAGRAAR